MRRPLAALCAVLALVGPALAGCSSADGQVQRAATTGEQGYVGGNGAVQVVPPAERAAAVDFRAPLLSGPGSFDLAAARGDVVVLNVWASWCAPCRAEAKGLQRAWTTLHRSGKGVRFLGVNTKDTPSQARSYLSEFGVTYATARDEMGEALLAFRGAIPPNAIPTTLVLDQQGRVAARVTAEVSTSTVLGMVEDVLAEEG